MSDATGRDPDVPTGPPDSQPAAQVTGRPGSVTAAGWIAIAASVATGTYLAVLLGSLLLDRGGSREGVSGSFTAALVVAFCWCVGAVALAVLTMRGSALAGIGLALSAVIAGSISLTASAFFAAAVLTLVACVATIVLLLTGSAREWFRDAE